MDGERLCDLSSCERPAVVEVRFKDQRTWHAFCARHDARTEEEGDRRRRQGWPPWLIDAWVDLRADL